MAHVVEERAIVGTGRRHDWEKLRMEYVMGSEPVLSRFLETAIGQRPDSSGNVNLMTRGWVGERKRFWNERITDSVKESVEAQKEKSALTRADLLEAKEKALERIIAMLDSGPLDARTLKTILEVIKTELGEPIRIMNSDITSKGKPIQAPIPLTREQKEALLQSLLYQKAHPSTGNESMTEGEI